MKKRAIVVLLILGAVVVAGGMLGLGYAYANAVVYGRGSKYMNSIDGCHTHAWALSQLLNHENDPEMMNSYVELSGRLERGEIHDGWGNPYLFVPFDPDRGDGSVTTLGRDAEPGGDFFDLNRDYTVWFDTTGIFFLDGTNRVYTRRY